MKKLLFAAIIAAVGMSVQADSWLYWMVQDANVEFDYATVKVQGGSGFLNLYDDDGAILEGDYATKSYSGTDPCSTEYSNVANILSYGAGSTFLIELWDDNDIRQGYTSASYATLLSSGAIRTGDYAQEGTGTWTASTFTIPEPTSGTLLALGMLLVGLRRRRRA